MAPKEEIKSTIVAYLGPPASYTHQAALETFPQSQGFHLSARGTISDVFTSVQDRTAKYGVVPFENSTYGSVVPTLDLFADRESINTDVVVCNEVYLDIHHYLLGHLPPLTTLPADLAHRSAAATVEAGSTSGHTTPTPKTPNPLLPTSHPIVPLTHVKRVYSHYQAFGQCDLFLSAYLKNAERQETSSTSKAAQIAIADKSGESAAISSYAAAEVHGLSILAVGIEDKGDNSTRFLALRRKDAEDADGDEEGKEWKTMVGFTIDHQVPGKLADALTVFKECGLNLTSINSRPSKMRPWHYFFFVEFGGRREEGNNVDEALRHLDGITEGCRFYGSWKDRSPQKKGHL